MRRIHLRIISFILFFILLFTGFQLAKNKPLWNDEIYSQTGPVQGQSYGDMFLGKISEGSNAPLFYVIQKTLCLLAKYKLSIAGTSWFIVDQKSQIILRVFPNFYMALAITFIFYFFSRHYSVWAGFYALLVSFSSPMIWRYWVEARPYSLWILLTIVQILLFLVMLKDKQKSQNLWKWLMITHILMAFTVVFSLAQMVIISILLWYFGKEKKRLSPPKAYFVVTIISIVICLFYYAQAPKYNFWFDQKNPPVKLLTDCFPIEYIWMCGVYLFFYGFTYFFNKEKRKSLEEGKYCLSLLILTGLAALALLSVFIIKAVEYPNGFAVVSRYFLFLTPVVIIGSSLFSVELFKQFKGNRWISVNLVILFTGLLIIRFMKTYLEIYSLAIYWR